MNQESPVFRHGECQENLLKAKDFSWGLKEAEDMDAKRVDQSVGENMCQEVETGFSGPRL